MRLRPLYLLQNLRLADLHTPLPTPNFCSQLAGVQPKILPDSSLRLISFDKCLSLVGQFSAESGIRAQALSN